MPPRRTFRRKTPKVRRTFRRKMNRKLNRKRDAPRSLVCRQIGGFPDKLLCKFKIAGTGIPPASTSSMYTAWRFNDPTTTFGPSVNAGAFASNYPSGLAYLITQSSNAIGIGPYLTGRVNGAKFLLRYVPTSTGPASVAMVIYPSTNKIPAIPGSVSWSQLAEQPYAKTTQGPGNLTSRSLTLKSYISTRRLMGYKYKASLEGDTTLNFLARASPATLLYWNWGLVGDGATSLQGSYEWEFTIYCELFNRTNVLSSAQPT